MAPRDRLIEIGADVAHRAGKVWRRAVLVGLVAVVVAGLLPAERASALGTRDGAALAAMSDFAAGRRGVVAWCSRRNGGQWRIWACDFDGQNLRQVSPNDGSQHVGPVISPDGASILYLKSSDPSYSVMTCDVVMVDATDTDGSSARTLVTNCGTTHEFRGARWVDTDRFAYVGGSDRDGYLYTVSSGTSGKLFSWSINGHGALPNPQRTHCISSQVGGNHFARIDNPGPGGTTAPLASWGGCQASMAEDGVHMFRTGGMGGPICRMSAGDFSSVDVLANRDGRFPSGQRYLYFPQYSACQRFMAICASPDQHDHFNSDYDVFVVPTDPATLMPVGNPVKYCFGPTTSPDQCDTWPDVWVEGGGSGPVYRQPDNPTGFTSGALNVEYYQTSSSGALPDFGALTPYASDAVGPVDFTGTEFATSGRSEYVSAVFTGYVEVPADGYYTFYTESDDGSALYIGTTKVVDNDGVHGTREISGTIGLEAGLHAVRVAFCQGTGGFGLRVSYQGPGVGEQVIPANSLHYDPSAVTPDDVDPTVTISYPSEGETVGATITATGTASDDRIVQSVTASVDGGGPQAASGQTDWTYVLDTTQLSDGTHTLTAAATDPAGNAGSATVSFVVDNSSPDAADPAVTIQQPSDGGTVSGTVSVSGVAWDDTGVSSVTVSVDGGASTGAVGTTTWSASLDTTGLTDGSHTITAVASDPSGKTGSDSVTVTVDNSGTVGLPLRINVGTAAGAVAGWVDDTPFVLGGQDWDSWIGMPVDLNGQPDPAPEEVYTTIVHYDHSYAVSVPNGTYVVRMHFYDGHDTMQRYMSFTFEGEKLISDLDILAEAGGKQKALIKQVTVTVSDGVLDIVGEKGDVGNDVFVSGIEVIALQGTSAVTIDSFGADPVQIAGGESSTLSWSVRNATSVSIDQGVGDVTSVTSVAVSPSGTTTYTLTAQGEGGPVTAQATLTVVAAVQPSLTIVCPNGGEVLYAGTTFTVRWDAHLVTGVTVLYLCEGTWWEIAPSVRAGQADWGAFEWVVPDTPTESCEVMVSDYGATGVRDGSDDYFAIRSVEDADDDGMDDRWETANFGDLTHDQTTDTDGDGLTDYQEFMNNTDPLRADSGGGGVGFGCATATAGDSGSGGLCLLLGGMCAIASVLALPAGRRRSRS